MNFIRSALGLIGGASSLYSIGATLLVVGGAAWYFYHSLVTVPVNKAKASLSECQRNMQIKDAALSEAGKVISRMGQELYDMNQSIKPKLIDVDIRLIECQEELEKERGQNEKIDFSDEFYYTKLPF